MVQPGVDALLGRDVAVHARERPHLQQVDEEDQQQHDRAACEHDERDPARLLALADLGGKEVDLAHWFLPGIPRPMAAASTGSASACASGTRSSCDFTR